jgi:glyoxylase-like metal-dependent hydrolase (beta-lactamase superfamily II)/8-oxo-dGTP pyrophosphatase MutT (NUDIX family)
MVRPAQLLHAQREPAPLQPAATVLLLRDTPAGPEVLMTRRSASARFAPGAFVFPGGGIDASDTALHAQAHTRPDQPHLTEALAALREAFEELGILLASDASGQPVAPARVRSLDRQAPLATICRQHGLTLNADQLFLLAHWITDRDLPRRFDVPFWVARLPEGQEPVADEAEQFEPLWVRPADALKRHEAGQFFMVYPTVRTLERLADAPDVAHILAQCQSGQALWTSCPRAGWLAGHEVRYMEHEAPYGELALTCPDGQLLHHLDWQTDHPVALLRNVQRLTAPNPGFMTGPGTNSYLVGDPQTGYAVIDPGPADEAHIHRLWQACGGDIRYIVCTHSHPDHSPGAAVLRQRCEAAGRTVGVWGLPSAPTARANSQFTPDHTLADNACLQLTSTDGSLTHTLKALHTPGHAANHVCLVLVEDGLLLSGDHILNGSTTVVDPPDGNMSDYLDSLDRLSREAELGGIAFILPAHGHVLGQAPQAIQALKTHRLKREALVLAAMQALPDGTPDAWVAHAYADVPQRLWPVAMRSLLAHVQRIQALNLRAH